MLWWFEWNIFDPFFKRDSIWLMSPADSFIRIKNCSSILCTLVSVNLFVHFWQVHSKVLSGLGIIIPLHSVHNRVSKFEPRSLGSLHRGHSHWKFQLLLVNSLLSNNPSKKLVYLLKISWFLRIGVCARTQTTWSSLWKILVLATQEWFMVAKEGCRSLMLPFPSPALTAQALVRTMEMYLNTCYRNDYFAGIQ